MTLKDAIEKEPCKEWVEKAFKGSSKQKAVLLKCMAKHRNIFHSGARLNAYTTFDKYFKPFFTEVGLEIAHTTRSNFCSGGNFHTTWSTCPFIKEKGSIWRVKKRV